MGEKIKEIINSIQGILREGPKSISEISEKTGITWRTAKQYLQMLKDLNLVGEEDIKNTKTFFYKDNGNYFELPIKKEDNKEISSIYAYIKESCLKFFNKEPTKTQIYKIIWNVNKKLDLKLPIGWYRYGPCCVQIYRGNEEKGELDKPIVNEIEEVTKEYCCLEKFELQKKIYEKEKMYLYLTKEGLLEKNHEDNREELNNLLMDLIKYAPKETIETVTDFARVTLVLGWKKTKDLFIEGLWKYLTMIIFRDTLRFYYGIYIEGYFEDKIKSVEKEVQLEIVDMIKNRTK